MLTLICGLPNAGKTTYSQRFDNVIHLDEVGRTSRVCEMVEGMGDTVVEGVFATSLKRRQLIDAGGGYSKCIWLDVPLDECKRREDRGRPEFILENAAKYFEPPTYDEGWDEIEVIRWPR